MKKSIGYKNILMVDERTAEANGTEVNYKALFYKYILTKWPYYLVSVVLLLGLSFYYIKSAQPVYEISSKLLIKEEKEDYSAENDWVKKNLNFTVVSDNVVNEIEILTSFALMREVIDEMNLDVRYYWKDKLSEKDAYQTFPIEVDTFQLHPIENTDFKIIPIDSRFFQMTQDEFTGKYEYGKLFSNKFGTFRFELNESGYTEPEKEMRVAFWDIKEVTQSYLDEFAVDFSDVQMKSSTLQLSLKDVNPQRGEEILTKLIQKYNSKKHQEDNQQALKTLDFINVRLQEVRSELATAESSLEQFKLRNNIASKTTSDLNILLSNMNELGKEQKELEVDLGIIQSMKEGFSAQADQYNLIPLNLSLVNVQTAELIKPYNDLVLQQKKLLQNGQPDNPIVQSVNQDLASLKMSILGALENMQNDIQLQLETKNNQYEDVSQRLKSVPSKERQLIDRARKQSVTEDLYVYLLKKKEETSLALINNFSDSNVIDPPRSSIYPVSPKKKLFMFAGLMGGLAIPLFFIVMFDFIRDTVLTEKELKSLISGVNIVGMISKYEGKDREVKLLQRRDITSEHFRAMRTKLQFHYRVKQKCIMVTSSVSSEGKTFVAANLAMSYAMSGKKTIILDFDLHRSDMRRFFQDAQDQGLAEFFGGHTPLEEVIQKSSLNHKLDYIASGTSVLHPSEILTDQQLSKLFEELKKQYDIIVVDTPPVGIISDALLLNRYVTNSLYVVRSGVTKKEMLFKAKELFDNKLLTNPSLVLNGVRKADYYGYGYRSYKKYAS